MRFKGRKVLAAFVAVLALCAVASASALAAPPEFTLKAGEKFPSAIEGAKASIPAGYESTSFSAACSTNKSKGEVTGTKEVSLTLEWTGCHDGTTSLNSEGSPAGDIAVAGTGSLVFIHEDESSVGILFTLKTTTIYAGSLEETLKGSVLIPITPVNKEIAAGSPSLELAIDQEKPGVPKYTRYENEKGEAEYAALRLEAGGEKAAADLYVGASSSATFDVSPSKALTVSTTSPPPAWLSSFGSEGKGNGQFSYPGEVAVASNGDVYVTDTGNDRVQEFGPEGKYIRQWGSAGTGNGQFNDPKGIAVATNGDVYVVDAENERVQEFSSEGKYIRQWGSVGSGNGQFGVKSVWGWEGPDGIAVAPNGDVYVTDEGNHRVEEFTSTGGYITQWGSFGHENGQFSYPHGIAVASNGDVYVADECNTDRIQEFTGEGTFIRTWGSTGSGNGQFNSPHGLAVNASGDLYLADEGNDRVQEFSPTGGYFTQWGTAGTGNGQFNRPTGVAVASNGDVYVVDKENDRIQKFE